MDNTRKKGIAQIILDGCEFKCCYGSNMHPTKFRMETLNTNNKIVTMEMLGYLTPHSFFERVKYAFRILVKGELNMFAEALLDGEEYIDAMIKTLEEGKNFLNKEKE